MHPKFDPLSELPSHDVSSQRTEAIRREAHRVLNERRALAKPPDAALSGWSRAYHRFVEPAALMALGLSYLLWTVHDTVALFR